MKLKLIGTLLLLSAFGVQAQQKVIPLYPGAAPGSENWTWNEGESDNNAFNTKVVYNVTHPSLSVFLPDSSITTGTAVVICPGGGFHTLSINSEGYDVAKWLNKQGVACFVLKYRLAHSLTNDPVKELVAKMSQKDFPKQVAPVIPLAIADARAALTFVREHASEYHVSPQRIGIMGFSAGGTLAGAAAFNYTAANKPDFDAPIYAYVPPELLSKIPDDAPPMFIAAATDDQLGLAPHSIDLYNKWLASKHSAELHMYAKGGHGFGMRKQSLPTDNWIDRFNDWLDLKGFLKPIDPKVKSVKERADQWEAYHKQWEDAFHKDWANMTRYKADNEKVKASAPNPKSVVYMGDSITDFWLNRDSTFWSGKPYFDRGISGQTTTQMLVRFREDVIDLKPGAVVILAGINDIAQNNGPITIEDIFGNIQSMALLAKAANIKVVLCSVLPAYAFPWRPGMEPAQKVVQLNAMIKSFADANKMVYVDYHSAMADERKGLPKNLAADGVHPTVEGYRVMGPLVEKGIAEALKRK